MTHTPKPWIVAPAVKMGPVIIGEWDGYGSYRDVAELSPTDEAEANARLIVAAPDMLDALHHLYNIVSTGILHQSSLSKDGIIELLKDAQETAHTAFTKAKGK